MINEDVGAVSLSHRLKSVKYGRVASHEDSSAFLNLLFIEEVLC